MASVIPSITSAIEVVNFANRFVSNFMWINKSFQIEDVKICKYEWNVLIPPYSKMVRYYESTERSFDIKNIKFNVGELASVNHSM